MASASGTSNAIGFQLIAPEASSRRGGVRRRKIPGRNAASPPAGPRGRPRRQEPGPGLGGAAGLGNVGVADVRRRPGRVPGPILPAAAWRRGLAVGRPGLCRLPCGPDALELGRNLLPLFGLLLAAGVAVNLAQVGFLFLPEKLAPDITRLDPLKGMRRIFSLPGVMRLAFGLVKIADRRRRGLREPLQPAGSDPRPEPPWRGRRSPCSCRRSRSGPA